MIDDFVEIIVAPISVGQRFLLSAHTAPDPESDAKVMAMNGMSLFSPHLLRGKKGDVFICFRLKEIQLDENGMASVILRTNRSHHSRLCG